MESTLKEIFEWGLNLVMIAVGSFLIIRGLIDVGGALGGRRKEWGSAIMGIGIGLLGGFIGWWGATNIIDFFKSNGDEIPID